MNTPIFDFVKKYADSKSSRFHMPGHKGVGELGCESYDITEISGADVLYSADGIIAESENNLSSIYGTAHSFYSTEGSTLAIKAMLALACEGCGERPFVLAARNVHTAFIKAAALLDIDADFIYPERAGHLCECKISGADVRAAISSAERKPCAVYVTSPDYLGNMLDIREIADTCSEFGVPLLVDNAHGAYLKFLSSDLHPISLGAAMCTDSAHKTLPVLTGGAYLHISKNFSDYVEGARRALSLFASTSPSYLTLASLDLCNKRLGEDYPKSIPALEKKLHKVKEKIFSLGIEVCDSEPLKIVVREGNSLANHLRENDIEVEFADEDYTVIMATPDNTDEDFHRLISSISSYKPSNEHRNPPSAKRHERVLSIRKAVLAAAERVNVDQSVGRICSTPTVSCPPAVPIVISGERITEHDVEIFKYYGINSISVTKTDS